MNRIVHVAGFLLIFGRPDINTAVSNYGFGLVGCALKQPTPFRGFRIISIQESRKGKMIYRCEAKSLIGFVQQLAVAYLANGYWLYVTGKIPDRKDPDEVDRKLIEKYGIDISKWARARRKRLGHANLQYIRHDRFFVILATHGEHTFFEEEAKSIRNATRVPIKYRGYSISYRGGHSHVRIERGEYNRLKAYLLDLALRRSREKLENEFSKLHFEPYAPVRNQLFQIFRAVNRARKVAGYQKIDKSCIRTKRQIVRPFE